METARDMSTGVLLTDKQRHMLWLEYGHLLDAAAHDAGTMRDASWFKRVYIPCAKDIIRRYPARAGDTSVLPA